MSEIELIKTLAMWVDNDKYPYQICNAFIYKWECDYWAMTKDGDTREFEIKISRADYFNDAKKDKHKASEGANYFYYVCPHGLIKKEEVDKRYGLIYVGESVEVVKKPRKLHENRFDNWQMLANKMYWRYKQLWREKYINKEISREEYFEGFNLSLEEIDNDFEEVEKGMKENKSS